MRRNPAIFLLLLILPTCLVNGQKIEGIAIKRYPVKTINFENGLLNNATTDVITDLSGFTWISTLTGLQRFNGYRLETVQPVVGEEVININYPVYFFPLHDGSIWISFKEGILRYSPLTGTFSKPVSYTSATNSQFSIIPLKETDEGIWCMHEKKGIVMYNKSGGQINQFSFFPPKVIYNILNTQQLLFLKSIAVNENYIFINNPSDQKILSIDIRNKTAAILDFSKKIFGIACNSDHLYLLTDDNISSLNIDSREVVKSISIKSLTNESLLRGSLNLTIEGGLIAGINNDLYALDAKALSPVEITDLKKSPVLLTGFIHKIYADKFHRIWILTNNDVKRIQDVDIPFAHFLYPDEKNNFVKALYYDEQKQLLIAGCFNGGIQLYDTLANPLWKKPLITPAVKNIISIAELEKDKYLLITLERGWHLLDLNTNRVRPFSISPAIEQKLQPTKVNFANSLQRINDSVVFIATATNVFRCIFDHISLKAAKPLFKQDMNNSVSCVRYSSDKTVWVGSIKGLVYRIDKDGELKTIEIPGNFVVRTIAEDDNHNIWIGTDKGLNVFNASGRLQRRVVVDNGLLNDCIYSILPVTGKSAIFCSTNLGLSYISLDNTIKNFSREMGLQENEFNTNAAIKVSNGKLYFGGINGITSFYPSALSVIKDTPVLNITRLIVNDSLLNPTAANRIPDTINLGYRQNRIRLDLAALGMLNTNEYVYKYRMHGFENGWQTTNQPTGINYTLQPGNYMLEVSFYPALSAENIFRKQFIISITPPVWQTWWFRTAVFFVGVAVVALMLQRYNRTKYKRKILALQIQHRLQTEKERISRELHDDLGTTVNLLSYNVSLLSESDSESELRLISERIKSSTSEMLQSLRETVWTLKQESITTDDVWTRFKNFIAKFQAAYSSDIQILIEEENGKDKKLNYNKALNLIRILQEAVNNALRHSACTIITCCKKHDGNLVNYSISDNGKGFNYHRIQEGGSGNGLQNMEQRAKESGLEFSIMTNEGQGTTVSIKA